jgi:acetylornithine deacetylase/succinyl-diaminopimelate desuccinylase-like protein
MTTTDLEPLLELLRIPSVSADPAHAGDLELALGWVAAFLERAGGRAEIVDGSSGRMVVGDVPASSGAAAAPTVLLYGHVDVQPPEPVELWESPPFEPTIREGWMYCRGVADDKGQVWILLDAVRELAAAGALPVNVRVLCDAEEEIGGTSAPDWIAGQEGVDACVIFDTSMLAGDVPAFNLGTRGTAYFHVTVETGRRDVHSGVFGGAGLNAMHVLVAALATVAPPLPAALREGTLPPGAAEVESWSALRSGALVLADEGVLPADARAAADFYRRTWAETSLDVNGIAGGSPQLMKTILPARAEANLSMRLAYGQAVAHVTETLERLLTESLPAGATLTLELMASCEASLTRADTPAITLAQDAFERALGTRPVLVRSGGSLPVAPALEARGIPALITGFDVPGGNIHSPNERFRIDHLELGRRAARELLTAYAGLA